MIHCPIQTCQKKVLTARYVKLFQQMGFQIKEIKELIDAPGDVLKSELEKQVEKRKEEKKNIERSINTMYEWIAKL